MPEIRNLDEITGGEIQFILGGKTYSMPSSLTFEAQLRLIECGQKASVESLRESVDILWDEIAKKTPKAVKTEFMGKLSIEVLTTLINMLTKSETSKQEGPGESKNVSGAQRMDQ